MPEEEIADRTALLAELTGIFADSAGGVAVGTLIELVRTAAIRRGGAGGPRRDRQRPEAACARVEVAAQEIESDVDALLAALGVA